MEKKVIFLALVLVITLFGSASFVGAQTNAEKQLCATQSGCSFENTCEDSAAYKECLEKITTSTPQAPKVIKQAPDLVVERWEFDFVFRTAYLKQLKTIYPDQFKDFGLTVETSKDKDGNPVLTPVTYKQTVDAICYFKGNSGACRVGPLNLMPVDNLCKKDVGFDINFRKGKNGWFVTKLFKDEQILSSINDECAQFAPRAQPGQKANQCKDITLDSCFGLGTTNSILKKEEIKGETIEPLFSTEFTAPTTTTGFARFSLYSSKEGEAKINAVADFTGRKVSRYQTTDNPDPIIVLNSKFNLPTSREEKPNEQVEVLAEEVSSSPSQKVAGQKGLFARAKALITWPFSFATKVVKFPFKLAGGALKTFIKDPKKGLYANVKNWIDKTFFAREIKITKELANVKLTDAQKKKLKECEESYTTLGASSSEVKQVQVSCRCLEFPELFKDTCQYALARNYVSVTEYSSLIRDKCTTTELSADGKKALYAGQKWESLSNKSKDACYALYKVPTPNLAFVPFQIKILGGASSAVASATQPSKPSTSASTTAPASQQPGAPASAQAEAELIRRQARALTSSSGLPVELVSYTPQNVQPSTQYFTTIPAGGLIGSYSVDGQPLGGVGMGGYGAPDKAPPLNTIVSSGGGGGPGSSAQVTESPPGTEVTAESTDEGDLVITEQCVSEEECAAGVTSVEVTDPAESEKKVITFVSDPVDLSAVSEVSAPLAGRSNAEIVSLFVLLSLLAVLGATSWYYFHEKKLVE